MEEEMSLVISLIKQVELGLFLVVLPMRRLGGNPQFSVKYTSDILQPNPL